MGSFTVRGAVSFQRRDSAEKIGRRGFSRYFSPSADFDAGHKPPLDDHRDARNRSCAYVATFEIVVFVPVEGWAGKLRRA